MKSSKQIKDEAIRHLWMANQDWSSLAEEGGPTVIVKGDGLRVTDSEGNSWIDVNGGYISVAVGHGRTEIADAAYSQAKKISFMPAGTTTEVTVEIARKLAEISPGSLNRVYPVSGGSEATETALKIVRAYYNRLGQPERHKIISREGSYHGATGGVHWMGTSSNSFKENYDSVIRGMLYAPQPTPYRCSLGGETASECAIKCVNAIEDLIIENDPLTIAAVFAEPIAARGCHVPGDEYWPMLRDICDRFGILLVADEVVTGFGQTGKMFALEHWEVVPDIMALAKGMISTYLPFGATIVKDEIADVFTGQDKYLKHTFTATGHPVCSAAALKNIEIIEKENLVNNAAKNGLYFKEQLQTLIADHPTVGDVRGIGLLNAIELVNNRKTKEPFPDKANIDLKISQKLRAKGLLLRSNNGVIVLGPPLVITKPEIDEIIHLIDLTLWEIEGELRINSNV